MTDFIVDPLVEFCVNVIGEIGYAGIFLLMLVESANIPMPSEATMLFAGFKVEEGELTLLGITAAGVLGNVVGSWCGYAIGYWGREELLERHHVFHVSPKQMKRVEGWFERYGAITVFFTRMLPIVRTFISTPAGAAHMPLWRFTIYTAAGCIPWVLMLGIIGVEVGERWEEWRDKLHYFDYVVLAGIVGLIVYFLIRRRGGSPTDEPSGRRDAEPATEMRGCSEADAEEQPVS
ncbi:MAG TPA: DedA family protein [Solirubrobacterales bacterium]